MSSDSLSVADVTDPRDTDVLCGRGGAALRHPGNQTYRRLVSLNKGLYITCLKTEKLKISRSIVAAIREQRGRFLEKDTKKNVWYDIGDKKAVEKTSQALREGQPKLRQKIMENGGGVDGTAAFMQSQYGHSGLYNPEQVGLTSVNLETGAPLAAAGDVYDNSSMLSAGSGRNTTTTTNNTGSALLQQRVNRLRPSLSTRNSQAANELGVLESNLSLMSDFSAYNAAQQQQHPGSFSTLGSVPNDSFAALSMDSSFRRSLHNMANNMHLGSATLLGGSGHMRTGSNHSINRGMESSTFHTMDISSHNNSQQAFAPQQQAYPQQHQQQHTMNPLPVHHTMQPPPPVAPQQNQKPMQNLDRRRVFAKMKYNRPPSVRHQQPPPSAMKSTHQQQHQPPPHYHHHSPQKQQQQQDIQFHRHQPEIQPIQHHNEHHQDNSNHFGDGMPEFNMVESVTSMFSNMSGLDSAPPTSPNNFAKPEIAKVIDHTSSKYNAYSEVLGTGSRHSIMSGLSRISDNSIDQSIFSDLSKKLGNVSTRSLSEVSAIDMTDHGDSSNHSGTENISLGISLATGTAEDSKSSVEGYAIM